MSKCRALFRYCQEHNHAPLPASSSTVIGYVLYELQRGALAPPSLTKYLSAVASLHSLAGHADPTKDKLVQLAVYGFRAHALERAGGKLALLRMPLPAAHILEVCSLGLSTPGTFLQLQCATWPCATSCSTGLAPRPACAAATWPSRPMGWSYKWLT